MNHKELTAHFRARLKASRINAKCKMDSACGYDRIRISPPTFDASFSDTEQREILLIASANGMTLTQGLPIVLDQMTYSREALFEIPNA